MVFYKGANAKPLIAARSLPCGAEQHYSDRWQLGPLCKLKLWEALDGSNVFKNSAVVLCLVAIMGRAGTLASRLDCERAAAVARHSIILYILRPLSSTAKWCARLGKDFK